MTGIITVHPDAEPSRLAHGTAPATIVDSNGCTIGLLLSVQVAKSLSRCPCRLLIPGFRENRATRRAPGFDLIALASPKPLAASLLA